MTQLAKLMDYFFLNVCSVTHESEAENSRSLCQVLTFRLNTRISQLACSVSSGAGWCFADIRLPV